MIKPNNRVNHKCVYVAAWVHCRNFDHNFLCPAGAACVAEQTLRRSFLGHAAHLFQRSGALAGLWHSPVGHARYRGQCRHAGSVADHHGSKNALYSPLIAADMLRYWGSLIFRSVKRWSLRSRRSCASLYVSPREFRNQPLLPENTALPLSRRGTEVQVSSSYFPFAH
jgi:hypothetical protein